MAELAATPPGPVKGERLASSQEIPLKFLENILTELRRAELVATQRGAEGGYRLARPADEITLADVIRAVDGPLANVRGERPDVVTYAGAAAPLHDVWLAVRTVPATPIRAPCTTRPTASKCSKNKGEA